MKAINFKFGTELTFKSVISERAKLQQVMITDGSDRLCLDLSNVSHCDSAGLALLIEARKLCKQHNKTFEVIGISGETRSLAEFCGVECVLEQL
ncbi:MAG: lipid asymmetry maintenance protein MlaB [Legionellales bacterium]